MERSTTFHGKTHYFYGYFQGLCLFARGYHDLSTSTSRSPASHRQQLQLPSQLVVEGIPGAPDVQWSWDDHGDQRGGSPGQKQGEVLRKWGIHPCFFSGFHCFH